MGIVLNWTSVYTPVLGATIDSFPVVSDGVHDVLASHVNSLATSLVAVETLQQSLASTVAGLDGSRIEDGDGDTFVDTDLAGGDSDVVTITAANGVNVNSLSLTGTQATFALRGLQVLNIQSGNGQTAADDTNGSDISIIANAGGPENASAGGNGGSILVNAGAGGSGFSAGQAGTITLSGGRGADATVSFPGSAGGTAFVLGGDGGDGAGSAPPGFGGPVVIRGGDGGTVLSAGAPDGGNVSIRGGQGRGLSGSGGTVTLDGGDSTGTYGDVQIGSLGTTENLTVTVQNSSTVTTPTLLITDGGLSTELTVEGSQAITMPSAAALPGLTITGDATSTETALTTIAGVGGSGGIVVDATDNTSVGLRVIESFNPNEVELTVFGLLGGPAVGAGNSFDIGTVNADAATSAREIQINGGNGGAGTGILSGGTGASIAIRAGAGGADGGAGAGAPGDITFNARGSGAIPFNEAGNTTLAGSFAASSIVGALNELKSSVVPDASVTRFVRPVGANSASETVTGFTALSDIAGATARVLSPGSATMLDRQLRSGIQTATTANSVAGRFSTRFLAFAGNHTVFMIFGFTGSATTTGRAFVGFAASSSSLWIGTTQPSTLTDVVFVGFDSSDSEVQIMHNDAAGSCTKIPLGASFARAANMILSVQLVISSGNCTYTVTRLDAAGSASGTINSNIPADSQTLAWYRQCSTDATGTNAIAIDLLDFRVTSQIV